MTTPDQTPTPELISLKDLRLDGLQLRADGTDPDTVEAYAERYRKGGNEALPPLTVYRETTLDGEVLWLADGHHRFAAARSANKARLLAIVHPGGKREAIWHAAAANKAHGRSLTIEDKRAIVDRILADDEWLTMSDKSIADHCGVSNDLVAKRRKTKGKTAGVRKGKDGKLRTVVNHRKNAAERREAAAAATSTALADDVPLAALADQVDRISALILNDISTTIHGRDLHGTKAKILAAAYVVELRAKDQGLLLTDWTIDRPMLTELCRLGGLDVHPGQLVRAHLLSSGEINRYRLTDDAFLAIDNIVHDAKASRFQIAPAPLNTTPPASPPTVDVERRREDHMRTAVAGALNRVDARVNQALPFNPPLEVAFGLALVLGLPSQSEAVLDQAWPDRQHLHLPRIHLVRDHFYAALAHELADRLTRQQTADLPGLDILAGYVGLELDDLIAAATQAIPE